VTINCLSALPTATMAAAAASGKRLLVVLAHGAGAPSSHPWMGKWKALWESLAFCHTFDFPYIVAGRKTPPKAEKLIPSFWEAAREGLSSCEGAVDGIVFAGKSMGSRVACMALGASSIGEEADVEQDEAGTVRLSGVPVLGVVAFGYPLKGMKGDIRSGPLLELQVPALLCQGDRDSLGPLAQFREVIKSMKQPLTLYVVANGDHSLAVTKSFLKSKGVTQEDVDAEILGQIEAFVSTLKRPAKRDRVAGAAESGAKRSKG
jgi:uncharacterized protein